MLDPENREPPTVPDIINPDIYPGIRGVRFERPAIRMPAPPPLLSIGERFVIAVSLTLVGWAATITGGFLLTTEPAGVLLILAGGAMITAGLWAKPPVNLTDPGVRRTPGVG